MSSRGGHARLDGEGKLASLGLVRHARFDGEIRILRRRGFLLRVRGGCRPRRAAAVLRLVSRFRARDERHVCLVNGHGGEVLQDRGACCRAGDERHACLVDGGGGVVVHGRCLCEEAFAEFRDDYRPGHFRGRVCNIQVRVRLCDGRCRDTAGVQCEGLNNGFGACRRGERLGHCCVWEREQREAGQMRNGGCYVP